MLRQLVDKLPILILETEPVYLPIVEEVTKLICCYDNLTIVDLAISKLNTLSVILLILSIVFKLVRQ